MLHELVFSLLGYPGDIYIQHSDAPENSVLNHKILSERLPFIAPSEISLISQLLRLSKDYFHLQKLIRQFTQPGGSSLYCTALAYGIDDVLKDYRATLYRIETDLLEDENQSIVFIYSRVDPFRVLLSTLVKLVEQATNSDGKLHRHPLDIVLALTEMSFTSTKVALRTIAQHLMRVFNHQIASWILYGEIHDPGNEFMVDSSTIELSPKNVPSFLSPETVNDVLYTGKAVRQWHLSTEEENFSCRFAQLEHLDNVNHNNDQLLHTVDVDGLEKVIHDVRIFVSREVSRRMFEECNLVNYLRELKDVLLLGRGEFFLAFFDNLRDQSDLQAGLRWRVKQQMGTRDFLDRPPPSSVFEAQGLEQVVNKTFYAAARIVGMDDEKLARRFKRVNVFLVFWSVTY